MSNVPEPVLDRAILVIDDGEIKRYTTCRILERAGLKVVQAITGSQGLAMARKNPRLIVLDVKLPDIDGFEVCWRIKADPIKASIPVLHLSAHRTTGIDKAHGLDDGADAYLTLPVEFVLRAFLRESSDPTLALTRLNGYLIDGKQLNSAAVGAFVSLSLSIVDIEGDKILSSSAGAEPPLLMRANNEAGIELTAFGPLVAIDVSSRYQYIEASFSPGDLLVVATDGITEARRKNDFFGLEGIERAVLEAGVGGGLQNIADAIVRSALAFANGHQKDDVCMIVVRRNRSDNG